MTFHGLLHTMLGGRSHVTEDRVERIELEEVPVSAARWARTAVATLIPVVQPFSSSRRRSGTPQESAVYEYGEALQSWVEVPADVTDAHGYAVRYAANRL